VRFEVLTAVTMKIRISRKYFDAFQEFGVHVLHLSSSNSVSSILQWQMIVK